MNFLDSCTGQVVHIIYRSEENGYTVLRLKPDEPRAEAGDDGTIVVVGTIPLVTKETRLRVGGEWMENAKYGSQLRVHTVTVLTNAAPPKQTMDTITGTVGHVVVYRQDSGWGVLEIETENDEKDSKTPDLVLVKGVMPEMLIGERAEFTGRWINDARYGLQLEVHTIHPLEPQNREGIVRYLSENVYGVGDVTANRIYDHFKEKTLDVIERSPEKLASVPGLRAEQIESIKELWQTQRSERQAMIYLQGLGITSRLAMKIFGAYGAETIKIVEENPYKLADDIHGIGFLKADQIAQNKGIAVDSPMRIRASLRYALGQSAQEGHVYLPREELVLQTVKLLGLTTSELIDPEILHSVRVGALMQEILFIEGEKIEATYLPLYYHAERQAVVCLKTLNDVKSTLQKRIEKTEWTSYLAGLTEKNNVALSDVQQSAVQAALTRKITVLTGGPGTGKTTTLQMVIHALEKEGITYSLAAPTGRAAKRLAEATLREARTIHRLLEWKEGFFSYDEDRQLPVDFIIIDESSMLDILLFSSLLKAIQPNAHLMLVGDVDQLPSVGAGNVLKDVIGSGVAHVTRLSMIFRQAQASHIILNAHRINQGENPYLENRSEDFFFFGKDSINDVVPMVVEIVQNRLAKKLGKYDVMRDVQVIAPMYRGPAGVDALNLALQNELNPKNVERAELVVNQRVFRVGDKIMQTKNNYEKEVYNGDIGYIQGIDLKAFKVTVIIDDAFIEYDMTDLDQLILAYCISTHRSQGSEYPVVVMPVVPQHYMMLQRNLLYTAITRAKRMVVLVGEKKAVYMAVGNNKVSDRNTGLMIRLRSMLIS